MLKMYQLKVAQTKMDEANEPYTAWLPASSMPAASEKEAQSKFRAVFGPLRFGGNFPNAIILEVTK